MSEQEDRVQKDRAEPKTVLQALASVMEQVSAVGKTGTARGASKSGKEWSFSYRGVDAVVNAVGPAFRKEQIVMMPVKVERESHDVTTGGGAISRNVSVLVTYNVWGPKDFIALQVPGEAMDTGDKATAKAMSVAWRTALIQLLCLPTDEPDPDEDNYERESSAGPPTEQLRQMLRNMSREIPEDRIEQILRDNRSPQQRASLAQWITEQG